MRFRLLFHSDRIINVNNEQCVLDIYRVAQKVDHYHDSSLNRIKTHHWG